MTKFSPWIRWLPLLLLGAASGLRAQPAGAPASVALPVGSTAFCLFDISVEPERRVWINLAIVQYVELRPDGLRLYYGGGNLGSGHEFHLKASREEGLAFLEKMQAAAARCAGNGQASGAPSVPLPGSAVPSPDSAPPPPDGSHPLPGG